MFRRKVVTVLTLGLLIILVQMVALSVLNSEPPTRAPWEEEEGKRDKFIRNAMRSPVRVQYSKISV